MPLAIKPVEVRNRYVWNISNAFHSLVLKAIRKTIL